MGAPEAQASRPADLTPLTPAAREQFAQWNREYAEMARRFRGESAGKLHAVGKILQKGGAYDEYRLADSEVPWAIANGGKTAKEGVEAFLRVAPPEAVAALDDAFAFSLRRAAQRAEDGSFDLGKYNRWFSANEPALSSRPELLDRFNTAAKAQQRLNDIQASLAEHAASHPLNPGWGESGVLRQFWKPGPQGGETMRRYMQITGGRPEAVRAAEDYAALDFASRSGIIRDGEIVPKSAEAWLKQYEQAFSAVPGLADKFANAIEAQKAVQAAVERHLAARQEFTNSVAGAFIQDDPGRAIARVFSGADRAQKAQTLMHLVAGNPAATEGLQRAAIDHIMEKFRGAFSTEPERGGVQSARNFIADNRQVLEALFPGTAQNFDLLAQDLQRSQLVTNAKMPGGSDTAELLSRVGPREHDTGIGTIAAAVLGEHAGHHLMGTVGGPAGLIGGPILMRWLKGKGSAVQAVADKTLDRMLLDPQFALDMRRLHGAGTEPARTAILNRMGQRVVQSVIQAARSDDLQPPDKRVHFADGGRTETPEPWRALSPETQAAHLSAAAERMKTAMSEAAIGEAAA